MDARPHEEDHEAGDGVIGDPRVNGWESAYAGGHIDSPLDPLVQELGRSLDGTTAIDLGCGAGQNSIWLAEIGWTVTGVDIAPSAISQAVSAAARAGVDAEFLVADLSDWRPNGTFDFVISTYALPPRGPGRTHALTCAADAVAPGGTLLVAEFERSLARSGGWSDADLTDVDELASHLEGFEVARLDVETTRHAHGHHEEHYPVVTAIAHRPT